MYDKILAPKYIDRDNRRYKFWADSNNSKRSTFNRSQLLKKNSRSSSENQKKFCIDTRKNIAVLPNIPKIQKLIKDEIKVKKKKKVEKCQLEVANCLQMMINDDQKNVRNKDEFCGEIIRVNKPIREIENSQGELTELYNFGKMYRVKYEGDI